ncbi:acylneuraminate cytidylyltransferase family protein [Rhizobium sophorae]|uniref:Acylneuraminate cytidylyltransferase family protein n=1 Tax=Rhizobium sophorae TaxID=1535242 RepID=A0A7Y3SAK2_9HYPH|nr:acylneuraminate cytidylyltransferase family protein [Rhizobium sophorae]NNU38792.1 acylneuraminate cytidylyltransferase family protein [Rhizobium sophorae]
MWHLESLAADVEKKVLGLLPARGGSRGIPGKNVRPLNGRPLIGWAGEALSASSSVRRAICSTDDDEIARAAAASGLEVPWIRPAEISQDTSLVVDVILHALDALAREGDSDYDYVALVQATSPTVTAGDIDAAVAMAIAKQADTVVTGFHAGQRHPATMFSLSADDEVTWLLDAEQRMSRRQDLPDYFIRTGLVYVISTETLIQRRSIYGERIFCLVVSEERALTIDEERDFQMAEFLLRR